MNAFGWIFMCTSVGSVLALTGYCFYRVLTAPQPPAEEVKDFHSA